MKVNDERKLHAAVAASTAAWSRICWSLGVREPGRSTPGDDSLHLSEVLEAIGTLRTRVESGETLLRRLAEHTTCSSVACSRAEHYVALSDAAKKLVLSRRCALCDGFRFMPNRMDAPDGPICGCGQPSRHEDGWCGIEHDPVPCPACAASDATVVEPPALQATSPVDPKIQANAERWHHLALVYGYNELAKLSTTLGEKVFLRIARDHAEAECARLGANITRPDDLGPALVTLSETAPHVVFHERDIELMRAAVQAHDAAKVAAAWTLGRRGPEEK